MFGLIVFVLFLIGLNLLVVLILSGLGMLVFFFIMKG